MKLNFFSKDSFVYPLRWLIVVFIALGGVLMYTDATGYKIFNGTSHDKSVRGTGPHYIYHK